MIRSFVAALLCVAVLGLAMGCQQQSRQAAVPLPDVKVGLVAAVQPTGTSDLLAGYIDERRELASPEALMMFDEHMLRLVRDNSQRLVVSVSPGPGVDPSAARTAGRSSALAYWVALGKKAGVELLIVPQILNWHEREGSAAGVVSSAAIDVNYYLIDVKGEGSLLQRSHFEEKQMPLSSNLLNAGTFFKRGGKWLTAQELANESVLKMVREFGL